MTGIITAGRGAGSRVAPVRRVRDILRTRILAGVYGTRPLPLEAQLAAEFRASRNIVRDVLALLRMEGLVDRWRSADARPARRRTAGSRTAGVE